MRIETMQDLFLEQIRDLYDAEERLIKALPKMAEACTSSELRSCFEEHLQQTQGQIRRLDQVFAEIGEEPKGKTCEAMKGLIEEGEEMTVPRRWRINGWTADPGPGDRRPGPEREEWG